MKPANKSLFMFVLFFSISAFCVQHFWRGKTISADEAVKRWGAVEFDANKFKSGELKTRASMAASLKRREKEFKGKSVLEIREALGPTDGFYFTDVYPTYLIQIGKNHKEETWQIVFLLNNNRRVEGIIIHKNCCD
jgi:hypothetical protein